MITTKINWRWDHHLYCHNKINVSFVCEYKFKIHLCCNLLLLFIKYFSGIVGKNIILNLFWWYFLCVLLRYMWYAIRNKWSNLKILLRTFYLSIFIDINSTKSHMIEIYESVPVFAGKTIQLCLQRGISNCSRRRVGAIWSPSILLVEWGMRSRPRSTLDLRANFGGLATMLQLHKLELRNWALGLLLNSGRCAWEEVMVLVRRPLAIYVKQQISKKYPRVNVFSMNFLIASLVWSIHKSCP